MNKKYLAILKQMFAVVIGLIIISPIIYGFSISLMPKKELITQAGRLFPKNITFENYKTAFEQIPIFRYLFNSIIVALISSISRIIIAIMSAYSFAFLEFKGKKYIFGLIIICTLIPSDIMLMPNYAFISRLGLVNTYLGICSVSLVLLSAVLLMRQNFLSFPNAIRESAEMDGCSNFQFVFKILIPICRPIITTVFITSFISMWNDYLWPLIITTTEDMRTIQIGITLMKNRESINYGPVMAGTMIALLPTIIFFLIFRRQIIEGMVDGGIKE
ncbi:MULTISPECIES: carbohydrate ABC transporter permease [Facklamia]|uniref:carbohydrate ABC transporter permease n=1 Tax=Facklamia sp. HMSC062C11 TaxID=1739262 RepID=UPI0008A2CF47|nr:carbohydrate ABC transporter permease [Facklamia sp. HMSC062C11]OFL65559.1 ABC transporter permease [Facklamia sp. HMSC062C11]